MQKMWQDIAEIVEKDEREAPQRLVQERQQAQRERYERYMKAHTNRDFGDEHQSSDGRDVS